jgi:hypothetical protein
MFPRFLLLANFEALPFKTAKRDKEEDRGILALHFSLVYIYEICIVIGRQWERDLLPSVNKHMQFLLADLRNAASVCRHGVLAREMPVCLCGPLVQGEVFVPRPPKEFVCCPAGNLSSASCKCSIWFLSNAEIGLFLLNALFGGAGTLTMAMEYQPSWTL